MKQRRFAELVCGATSWNRVRRVIARLEHGPKGANPRFVVTNLAGQGRDLYDHSLLRPRRDGEPHQGAAAPALLRPHLLPPLVAQPVPPAAHQPRLHSDEHNPAPGAQGQPIRPRPMRHHPPQALMRADAVKRRSWLGLLHGELAFWVGRIDGWFVLRPGRNALRIGRACAHTQLLSGRFFGDGAPEPSLDPACCGRSVPEAGPIS